MTAGEVICDALGAAVGAALGSGITTAAIRAARNQTWFAGRSRCDACQHSLSYAQTIPLVSFVAFRGRCPACRVRIDWRHPVGELIGAGAGFCLASSAISLHGVIILFITFLLLYLSVFDIEKLVIQNHINLTVLLLSLMLSAEGGSIVYAALSAAAVFAFMRLVQVAFVRIRGREGLGGGDVKLMAALTAGIGLSAFSLSLAIAAGLALLWIACASISRPALMQRAPFGPFLSLGWAVMAYGGHAT